MRDRLADDKLNVAFVAEFSRGKSELINAIFFADYGQRLLPSSAGRTTMCPTELLYDPAREPSIQLLPIETRAKHSSTSEYKRFPDEWRSLPLNVNSGEAMAEAFRQVSETRRAPLEEAKSYGLYNEDDADQALLVKEDGTMEIPCWRHAIINFPHPLLKQGLVILDTPGLNAIGAEPELTLNLLPNAHAVLFILAADAGVTKSDIQVWRNHISYLQGQQKGRIIVLNKIDGLWDDLKNPALVENEISGQVRYCSETLGLHASQIFPVSAQKGLVAKVNRDDVLLARSRLPELEQALSDYLIPCKRDIVREKTQSEVEDMVGNARHILEGRLSGVYEQLEELKALRGKNQDVVAHMMQRIKSEKDDFEKSLQRFQALRSVFSQHTNALFACLGMDALQAGVQSTRQSMEQSKFSSSLRQAMHEFFNKASENLMSSAKQTVEIRAMMEAMYKKFGAEHGLAELAPAAFSMLKYIKEMERLRDGYRRHFDTACTMLTHEKATLMNKFFETLASRVVHLYTIANRDTESWLKAVMAPMETQVREHQLQLKRRLESIKHIHQVTDTLEDRITELEEQERQIKRQLDQLKQVSHKIAVRLFFDEPREMAA
ncbi:MAG TPA: dynamin family protein [Burkholderiales bacterium]|nr:dynamin family protein [Burkholderiales bacterium]